VWVERESQLDAVTALSGSGPAYVFLLVEALTQAGENLGLPAELAGILARETVTGAGELLHQSPLSAATLRENVTSPNGTTYAALQILMKESGGLSELMRSATEAAARRAEELAG
jgi:pyrroline-5-carboxylate reductase